MASHLVDKSGKDSDCSMVTFMVVDYDEVNGVKIKDIRDPTEREVYRLRILERLQNETKYAPTMIVDSACKLISHSPEYLSTVLKRLVL